jgi:hypothetical protein
MVPTGLMGYAVGVFPRAARSTANRKPQTPNHPEAA